MKRIGHGLAIILPLMSAPTGAHPVKAKHHSVKVIQPKVRTNYSTLPSGSLISGGSPYFQVGSPEYNARMKRIQEECARLAAQTTEDQKPVCSSN